MLVGCESRPSTPPAGQDWNAPPAGATASLDARVTFDAMRLAIENRDTRTWNAVVIEVRRSGSPRVYRYATDVLVGGRTLPMGALNFAADDGRRLSPFEGAPSEWRIQATLPDGSRGVCVGPAQAERLTSSATGLQCGNDQPLHLSAPLHRGHAKEGRPHRV